MTDLARNGHIDDNELLDETEMGKKDENIMMVPSTPQFTTAWSLSTDDDGDSIIDETISDKANDNEISQSAAQHQDDKITQHEDDRKAQHDDEKLSSDETTTSQSGTENHPSHLFTEEAVTETPAMIHTIFEEEDLRIKNQNHDVDTTILPVATTNLSLSVVSYSGRDDERLETEAKAPDKNRIISETPSSDTSTALRATSSMKLGRTNNLSFSASDTFAIPQPPPLPSLRRHTGVQWTTTPGAFRLSVSSPFSSTSSSMFNRSRPADNTLGNSYSDSESHLDVETSGEQNRESLDTSARSQDSAELGNDSMLERQWSSRRNLIATTPVEATLVVSTSVTSDDMEIPPPPGLLVAARSDEIIVAEAVQFPQKNFSLNQQNSAKSRVSRIIIPIALLVVGAAIAVIIKVLLRGENDPSTISYHAVVFGGRTSCPGSPIGKLYLYCAGKKKDSRAKIEILYTSSDTFCEIESNKARCYVQPGSSKGQYQYVNSGVLFSCKRNDYVDNFHVVTSAVFKLYNNSVGCSVADTSTPVYNRSIELSVELMHENTTKFIGLGHFCRLRDPETKETKWTLKRNVVVQDAVLLPEQCETDGAIYEAWRRSMLSYCYFPDDEGCNELTPSASIASWEPTSVSQVCNASMFTELDVTDSFSECQDSNVTDAVAIETLRILTNDAIDESRGFSFSYGNKSTSKSDYKQLKSRPDKV